MPAPPETSVLARIVAAHAGRGPGRPDPTQPLSRALSRALRRAAIPFEGFEPTVGEVSVDRDTDLDAIDAALPESGLIAGLEDSDGRRGLIAMGHSLVDALIEAQATGKVETNDLPARPVTRIDESLCRDFIDLLLGSFAKEIKEFQSRDWPARLMYGSRISDTRQLNLLFPERPFHLLNLEVTVAEGRSAPCVLALPLDPSLARSVARKAAEPRPDRPADWADRMLAAVGPAPLTLNAVLGRLSLPLGEVESWEDGSLVLFDPEMLEAVHLEGEHDHVVAKGALGQLNGRRAVRLGTAPLEPRPASAPGTEIAPVSAPMATDMGGFDPGAMGGDAAMPAFDPDAAGFDPNAAAFDPNAPALDPDAAGFDPNATGFDPNAPAFDPNAPGGGLPDLPMGDFDPNAPMG